MKIINLLLCFVFVCCVCSQSAGINEVIPRLSNYQAENGGFVGTDGTTSLHATSNALFLSTIFGQSNLVKMDQAKSYINSLSNADYGFGNSKHQATELSSIKYAIFSLKNLGDGPNNSDKLASLIQKLQDNNDLKSTALAIQSLDLIGSLDTHGPNKDQLLQILESQVKTEDDVSYFSDSTTENYYAIVVGAYAGFDFGDGQAFADFFLQRQDETGGFVSSLYEEKTSEITANAVEALVILESVTDGESFVEQVNLRALFRYTQNLPASLANAANSYKALAQTSVFEYVFSTTARYETSQFTDSFNPSHLIQGSTFRPLLEVRTTAGLFHSGLDVEIVITNSDGEKTVHELTYTSDRRLYETTQTFAAEKLGQLKVDFNIKWKVAEIKEELLLSLSEEKSIGYKLFIGANAQLGGEEIPVGGEIAFGTEFAFDLKIATVENPEILSGDFSVKFVVKDSAGVSIHSEELDCSTNNDKISFSHVLENVNLPAGFVSFEFSVGKAGFYHSVDSVHYIIKLQMVASEITFNSEDNEYSIGDKILVSMVPASFVDNNIEHFTGGDYKRKFQLVVHANENQVLYNIRGAPKNSGDEVSYEFEIPVHANFASIGNNRISFVYVTEAGHTVLLDNYDSDADDLYDSALSYSVKANLIVTNEENSISSGSLDYGNNVKFSFKVKDILSGEYISPGPEGTTAYLSLNQEIEGTSFVSASHPAEIVYDKFVIDWIVSPNAVKGAGVIELIARSANGSPLSLIREDTNEQWSVDVVIGGKIDISGPTTYSGQITDEESIFFVDFELSCQGVKLDGANIVAIVKKADEADMTLSAPVAHGPTHGAYSVSWTLNKPEAGDYVVELYRQVDLLGEKETSDVFHSLTINYQPSVEKSLPIRTEFFVIVVLVGAFGFLSYKKIEIEGTRKKFNKKNR
eukprot:TRINITY_DN11146_c0_g1_i1.p1 TRINITY_DN11146_c0_g1~~TRINITY_DN11146_c0_g1_i1.p1  ORF type:complete len:920 (+),score=250.49 TRINITY_DN11146_c0_g1_i1:63-2822(+)